MNTLLRYSLWQIRTGILSACLLLIYPLTHAAEEPAVGRVISTAGDVTASSDSGMRLLARGDDVFVGDIITTGLNSFAQLRFIDSAIVALKADTAFEITEYLYDATAGDNDRATMNLIQGGFRTITGHIGKANRDAYRVVTPFATIGIRGTDHEQVITPNGLVAGVFDGGISVQNASGSIDLGVGADYDFATVAALSTPPLGLTQQPPELGDTPISEEIDEEVREDGDDENDPNEEDGGPLPVTPLDTTASVRDQNLEAQESNENNQASINPNESGDGNIKCNNDLLICEDDEHPVTEPEPEPVPIPALTQAEEDSLDRSVVARLVRGNNRSQFRGQAGVDAGNSGSNEQNTVVLANGSTVLRYAGKSEESRQNVGGYGIEWGTWRSTQGNPIREQDRQDGSDARHFDDTKLLFAAMDEVTPSFKGRKEFAATDNFLAIAGAEGSSVSDVDGNLGIDLSTADVEGGIVVTVHTREGVNFWNGVVDGTLQHHRGQISGMQIKPGESFIETERGRSQSLAAGSSPRSFEGNINGIFTGDNASALLLDFDFWEANNSNNYVTGFSLFEQVEENDLEIDWGAWDMPVLDNWHSALVEPTAEHLQDKYQTSGFMLWILNTIGGSYAYESAGGFGQGFGAAGGELSGVEANFNIDFNTGDISKGQLTVTDANLQDWAVAFGGSLVDGNVSLSALPGTFTIDNMANNGEVTLGGAFTDFLASGFTGAFELIDGDDASNYVQGLFDLTRGSLQIK